MFSEQMSGKCFWRESRQQKILGQGASPPPTPNSGILEFSPLRGANKFWNFSSDPPPPTKKKHFPEKNSGIPEFCPPSQKFFRKKQFWKNGPFFQKINSGKIKNSCLQPFYSKNNFLEKKSGILEKKGFAIKWLYK